MLLSQITTGYIMFGTKMILALLSIIVAVSARNSSSIMVSSKTPTPSIMSTRTTSAIVFSSMVAPPSVSTSAIAFSSMVAPPSVSTSAMVVNSSTAMTTNSSSIAPSSAVVSTQMFRTTSIAPSNSSSYSSLVPTSTPVPTTMPTTTPKPKYNVNVTVKDENNNSCLWFEASIVINYMYNYNGTTKESEQIVVEQNGTNVKGVCSSFNDSEEHSSIMLIHEQYSLGIEFKNEKCGWIFSKINVTITPPKANIYLFGELNLTSSPNNGLFSALEEHAYQCDIDNKLDLKPLNENTTINVAFQKIYVQPFANNGTKTNDANVCPSGEKPTKSSSVVPIAVGCALAGLIVIVLIAYLIGRRRSDAKGYQQV